MRRGKLLKKRFMVEEVIELVKSTVIWREAILIEPADCESGSGTENSGE